MTDQTSMLALSEARYARRAIKCVECLATWEEEYALRGFVSLEGY